MSPVLQLFIEVDEADCKYTTVEDQIEDDEPYCGDYNPQVAVRAIVGNISNVRGGLVLTVSSSGNFEQWSQANEVRLPRDLLSFPLGGTPAQPSVADTSADPLRDCRRWVGEDTVLVGIFFWHESQS